MSGVISMGGYLRAARRQRRISIERAAEDTKIKQEFLIRMESDEFDFLAPAYVRGFLRAYARFLQVDPEPLLDEFDERFGRQIHASQVVALERRARHVPKQRRSTPKWMTAAIAAAAVVLLLAFVGLVSGPEGDSASDEVTDRGARGGAPLSGGTSSPSATPTLTPTPTVTPTPTAAGIVLADGIDVEIIAATADCWVDVDSDGADVFADTITKGRSRTFSADKTMEIVFGYPAGVEFIVDGVSLGAPGGEDPVVIKLPEDLEELQ